MKRKVSLLILLIVLVFGIKEVRAEEACQSIIDKLNSFYNGFTGIKLEHSGGTYNFDKYTVSDGSQSYNAYCRDAGNNPLGTYKNNIPGVLVNGVLYSAKTFTASFECQRKLNSSHSNKEYLAYENGIIEIIEKASAEFEENEEHFYTTVALRVYEDFWSFRNSEHGNSDMEDLTDHFYLEKYIENSDNNKIQNMVNTFSSFEKPNTGAGTAFKSIKVNNASGHHNNIQKLVEAGFDAAMNYNSERATVTWKNGVLTKATSNNMATQEIIFTIDGLEGPTAILKLGNFSCTGCNGIDISYEVISDIKKIETDNLNGINLLEYISGGKGEVIVKIKFDLQHATNYHCEGIDYSLNLEYAHESLVSDIYKIVDKDCPECQSFYVFYPNDDDGHIEREIKTTDVKLCQMSCEDAKNICENRSYGITSSQRTEACNIYNNEYGGNCSACKTYVNNAVCSVNDNVIEIKEGYSYNSDEDADNCITSGSTSGKEDVLNCVIGGEDENDNSYQVKVSRENENFTNVLNNDYCKVYCKEDYHITVPGIKEVNSGRYFTLDTTIKGTKTCYTSEIDKNNKFENKIDTLRKNAVSAYNEYVIEKDKVEHPYTYTKKDRTTGYGCYATVSTRIYNDTDGRFYPFSSSGACGDNTTAKKRNLDRAIEAYANEINEYNSCFGKDATQINKQTLKPTINKLGWEMKYTLNPNVKFWYEEKKYFDKVTDELETVEGKTTGGIVEEKHYSSELNNNPSGNVSQKFALLPKQFICYYDGSGYDCGKKNIEVGQAKYVSQKIEVSKQYITPTQARSLYPTGEIVLSKEDVSNSKALINGLPVGLGTNQGIYNYSLKIENLGEYYGSKTKLGRIWGDTESVVSTVLKENEVCNRKGALTTKNPSTEANVDANYVCAYKVNCPDCPVVCDPTCKFDGCPNNNCPVECDNCLFTNGNLNVSYKPTTPGRINPSNRPLGKNWKWDDNIETSLELKAFVTSTEIEELGEKIYNIEYDDVITQKEAFSMSITLDGAMINEIREYNREQKDNGGYLNNSLECYDHSDGSKTYENIYCYSKFLDRLIEKDGGPDDTYNGGSKNIKIYGGKRESEPSKRKSGHTDYWQTWTTWGNSSNVMNMVTTHELSIINNSGPSWK